MEKKKEIWDYFDENIEYPTEIAHNPIPYGTVWAYVSATFLNGFINYVNPIKWWLIDRYSSDNEDIGEIKVSYKNKGKNEWLNFKGTKGGLKDLVLSGKIEIPHIKLGCFHDDVFLLAEIKSELDDKVGRYMFFGFDYDVSDCIIGKFETEDTKEEVIQSIVNSMEKEKEENKGMTVEDGFDYGLINYTELPISLLRGWLSF